MGNNVIKEGNEVNVGPAPENEADAVRKMVKLEIFGEEMLEKWVKPSGASGRIYLPPDWVGHLVKVIRID